MTPSVKINLCLSDIPKDCIRTFDRNGKKYLTIDIVPLKEEDERGNNYTVFHWNGQEKKKVYLGRGKAYVWEETTTPAQHTNNNDDGLPF